MREIKEQKEITLYEAIDGEVFESRAECETYEKTATAVINAKFNKLIKKVCNSWELIGGYEDHEVLVVKMSSIEDVNTVAQKYFLDNPYLLKPERKQECAKFIDKLNEIYADDDLLLLGRYESLYILDSAKHYIKNLQDLFVED